MKIFVQSSWITFIEGSKFYLMGSKMQEIKYQIGINYTESLSFTREKAKGKRATSENLDPKISWTETLSNCFN